MKIFLYIGLGAVIVSYVTAIVMGWLVARVHLNRFGHMVVARSAFWTLAGYVAAIEACACIKGHAVYNLLFFTHLSFALPTGTILYCLAYPWTGLRWQHHGKLAFASVVPFSGMAILGYIMIGQHF